jgi:carotenoid cleavage dioxygenase-like enzyme
MQTEILAEFSSNLPADDTHVYRSGPWRPQHVERRAWDLDVEGEIPADLNGIYLRNTENPLHLPLQTYHPFDGDGMLHSMSFEDGDAVYHNRFVRTAGLMAEIEAGGAQWAGFVEAPDAALRADGWGARTRMKDASSTDVVVHGGVALSSFWQCGDLYRLDPVTLETLGVETWNGAVPADGVSAHTKVDDATGELLFFNYSTEAPYMHYGVVSAQGELVHYIDIPLPGPRLSHDMAFTEHYAILNDCPLFWDPKAMDAGAYVPNYYPDLPTRFAIVPRRGGSDEIRWFEADPTYVLHWINAYEDGDTVVLDGFFQHDPLPTPPKNASFEQIIYSHLDLHALRTEVRRWRFDLRTGATTEETLSDRVMEFGMINSRFGGRPYRYSYNALPCEGWFGFEGLVKHDLVTGHHDIVNLPAGVYASETVMAPREGATAEDDGYLLSYMSDMNNDSSACWIFDAADPTTGPLAKVRLPERISSGTHAYWSPADPR